MSDNTQRSTDSGISIKTLYTAGEAAQPAPELPGEFEVGPDDLLIRREQEAEFMDLLNQLPPPQRAVLLLHFIEEFSLEEIARITETRVGTVKSRLHYAKKSLRQLLEAENENTT